MSKEGLNNVFEDGNYATILERVECGKTRCGGRIGNSVSPPKPMLISRPSEEGEFPVLLFSHGYLLYNSFYSQLIQHVASHGFIVIAPQLYTVAGPDSTEEINSTAKTINWIHESLQNLLPSKVKPNMNKLALAGHSRGAKTSFALALSNQKETLTLKPCALIGIDPVDGTGKGSQTPPPVLTYVPKSFDFGAEEMPVMIVGSGLGSAQKNPLFPACAPSGVNHVDFFRECREPRWHFVVKDYGHLDMLDDETKGIRGRLTNCLCKKGISREPMRRFVGGVVVAFLKGYFGGDFRSLMAIRDCTITLPVELENLNEFLS